MLALTAKLPIISASPVYGKGSVFIPVNPLPSPTNVPVVVPETFRFPPTVVFPDKIVVPVKLKSPVEHEYSKVFVLTNPEVYSSVHDNAAPPPKASPAFCVPAPAKLALPVIKAPPVDHDDPLYSSVQDTVAGEEPPKASPVFCVPAPAKPHLAVIKAPPADQDVPLYSSVHDNTDG